MFKIVCKNCGKELEVADKRRVFCSLNCSSKFNGTGKKKAQKTKDKLSLIAKERFSSVESRKQLSLNIGKGTKGKFKIPKSLLEVSKRTITKIIKRMDLGCSICGWKKAIGDIHHINGRKVVDADGHWNLTYLCPNCHREFHSGLIEKETLITLETFLPENWHDFYYG